MAQPRLGIDVPDVVEFGLPFAVRIVGANDPHSVVVRIVDTETDSEVTALALRPDAGGLVASVVVGRPGLYRLSTHDSNNGGALVSCLFMAVEIRPDK